MIREINEELVMLKRELVRKKEVGALLDELYYQKNNIDKEVKILESIKMKEDKGVKKIEGISFQALLYSISGKKSEKIDKAKKKAYEATHNYNVAVTEFEDICKQISRYKDEWDSLSNVEYKYEVVLNKKLDYIKISRMKEVSKIEELEKNMLDKEKELKEIREAIVVGESVHKKANKTLDSLKNANDYSTWDVLGGGIISDALKHNELNEAQVRIDGLMNEMRKFEKELFDVSMDKEINVQISGGLEFVDYFFDGIFADMTVKNHIKDSMSEVENLTRRIEDIITQLKYRESIIIEKKHDIRREIEEIILNV